VRGRGLKLVGWTGRYLGEVLFVKQRHLNITTFHQRPDRLTVQRRYPAKLWIFFEFIDLRLRQHTAIANQRHMR